MQNQYWVHHLDPFLVSTEDIQLPYYWVNYVLSYFLVFFLCKKSAQRNIKDLLDPLFPFGWIGMLVGSKVFYALVYYPELYMGDLQRLLNFGEGGMSFHGGLIGGFLGIWLSAFYFGIDRRNRLVVLDTICFWLPIALGFGRVCNFINGELVGRPSDLPWAVIFPQVDSTPRHPSQIYQAFTEGPLLLGTLYYARNLTQTPGAIASLFLAFYSAFRFSIEFFRAPDAQIGLLKLNLTLGQWISIGSILFSLSALWLLRRTEKSEKPNLQTGLTEKGAEFNLSP